MPRQLTDWITDPDSKKAERTFAALMDMKKLNIATLTPLEALNLLDELKRMA